MKKFTRTAIVLIMALTCLLFAGNAKITYNEQKHGVLLTSTLTVELTAEEESKINVDSQVTLENYLDSLCKQTDMTMMRNLVGDAVTYTVMYASAYESPQERGDTGYESKVERGFFRHKITVSRINPIKLMLDEMQTGTYAEGSFADVLLNGIKDDDENFILRPFTELFPMFAALDVSDYEISYGMSEPVWFNASNASRNVLSTCIWTKEAGEDFSEQKIEYSYFVPNTLMWSVTVGIIAVVAVAVMFLAAKLIKDKKPVLADYRSMDEYSMNSALEKSTSDEKKGNLTDLPPDGYQGNGVFSQNGKTYDVFGNESFSAPVPGGDSETNKGNDGDLPDIFGN